MLVLYLGIKLQGEMNKRILAILWGVVILIIGAMILYYAKFTLSNHTKYPDVENAIFDLRNISFEEDKVVLLNGEVEFYLDTLLFPENFIESNTTPTGYPKISENWNQFITESNLRNGHGYGTYRFKVLTPEPGLYAIKIKDIKSAYQIFANGELLGGSGKVGTSSKDMSPSRYQMEYYFSTSRDLIDVVIQVSNFHHKKGGLTGSIVIGHPREISYRKSKQAGIELFIIGSLFILFIYHLSLFAFRRKDKSILYFSILCFVMFLRLGYTGERIMLEMFPFLSWNISIKLEYLSFFALPVYTSLFVRSLFPKDISRLIVQITIAFSILFSAIVLFFSPTTFSYIPSLSLIPFGILACYLLVKIGVALMKRRAYAAPIFIGFFIFFLLSIHDALVYINTINSLYLMPLGLFFASFSQAYVLAQKTSSAYARSEKLYIKLGEHAQNLELKVEKRTTEVQRQKLQIEHKAKELEETNNKLVKLARFKQDMTSMMIHDLKAPLNSIMGFTQLNLLENDNSKYILRSGWEMENLIQNILDVDKYESANYKPNTSLVNIRRLIEEAYNNIYFLVSTRKIELQNEISNDINLEIDNKTIGRVFVNIFSNAAKYAGEDIYIKITSQNEMRNETEYLRINIFNSGNPISQQKLDTLFDKFISSDEQHNYGSHSSGLGLAFCKLAIEAHQGEIGVHSEEGKGVTFWFTLPYTRKQ
ncbi:sensor histidine kinase [Labilibacter marinus]|uniref:sensor histidine kinase n=1 Tax=Labilibacter marinus TaxID=1477105 RepID=UPI000950127C|nr:sensor histidine kinase [Labilibacter marinus]